MLGCVFEIIQLIHFYPLFKHLDRALDMFWIKSLGGTFKAHFKRSNLAWKNQET